MRAARGDRRCTAGRGRGYWNVWEWTCYPSAWVARLLDWRQHGKSHGRKGRLPTVIAYPSACSCGASSWRAV
eukprot:15432836-Alexandrium_andersonii.AAC.1